MLDLCNHIRLRMHTASHHSISVRKFQQRDFRCPSAVVSYRCSEDSMPTSRAVLNTGSIPICCTIQMATAFLDSASACRAGMIPLNSPSKLEIHFRRCSPDVARRWVRRVQEYPGPAPLGEVPPGKRSASWPIPVAATTVSPGCSRCKSCCDPYIGAAHPPPPESPNPGSAARRPILV